MSAFEQAEQEINNLRSRVAALEQSSGGVYSPALIGLNYVRASDHGADPANADNAAQLEAAVQAAFLTKNRIVVLDKPGLYSVSRQVNLSGVKVIGSGPVGGTGLRKSTAGGGIAWLPGYLMLNNAVVAAPGGGLSEMGIYVGGVDIAFAVSAGTQTVMQPDRMNLEGLRITWDGVGSTPGRFFNIVLLNGTGRTSPMGCRGATMRDIEGFNNYGPAVVIHGTTNVRVDSFNLFTGNGIQSLNGFWFGGTQNVYCHDVQMDNCRCDGPLNLTAIRQSHFDGFFHGGVQVGGDAANAAHKVTYQNRA